MERLEELLRCNAFDLTVAPGESDVFVQVWHHWNGGDQPARDAFAVVIAARYPEQAQGRLTWSFPPAEYALVDITAR